MKDLYQGLTKRRKKTRRDYQVRYPSGQHAEQRGFKTGGYLPVKGLIMVLILVITNILVLAVSHPLAQGETGNDQTLSPYFFVKSDDSSTDQLPLKSTSAEINVAGIIADVTVRQVYKNEGANPIEAIYVFPASTRAAVYGMKMTIGDRTIVANVRERKQARQEYEQAKQEGKSASLLEQQRPNVFQMNVANILPGDVITVELRYTELLVPTNGVYELVYPTVVGPRYSNLSESDAPASEHWVKNPYLKEKEAPTYSFDLSASLAAGLPILDISCSTHKVKILYESPAIATITLDPSEKDGGNRDFILKYRLTGGKIESGLLLFEGEEENFFLCMVQPPERVRVSQIPPREYIFIVDVSGSMNGFPLNISKRLLEDLIGNLRPTDIFNVLLFAGGSSVMSDRSLPATKENVQMAVNFINRQSGGGGTNLLPALKKALALPHIEGSSRTVVIATDGFVTVEEEAFDIIRKNLGNANMFAFGIGSSVNRFIIEGIARVGMGEPFVITTPDHAEAKAEEFRRLIENPVLTDIKVDFGGFETYDVEPLSIPDVLAQRPVIIFGKWRGRAHGLITVQGRSGNGHYMQRINAGEINPSKKNSALRYLWARHRIALISDYNRLEAKDERIQEVTNLGLTYNLLTAYTSFVAIDSEARLTYGDATTIRQPLPLPQGVSDLALGKRAPLVTRELSLPEAVVSQTYNEGYPDKEERKGQIKSFDQVMKKSEKDVHTVSFIVKKISTEKAMDTKQIRSILEGRIKKIEKCVLNAVKGIHAFEEITISVQVDSKGRVTKIAIDKGKLPEEVKKCITKNLKKLKFPKSEDGFIAVIDALLCPGV